MEKIYISVETMSELGQLTKVQLIELLAYLPRFYNGIDMESTIRHIIKEKKMENPRYDLYHD